MFTWQEYIAGTDPQGSADVFSLNSSLSNRQQVLSLQTVATSAQYGLQRYYAIESCTNLANPVWLGVNGFTNIPGLGQIVTLTNTLPGSTTFFRGRVWLAR